MIWIQRVVRGAARGRWRDAMLLFLFAVLPALAIQVKVPTPQDRHIHMEAFRYGKDPSVIRCNRGDWLHLTFSTRDTGHSFFLDEFHIDAKITPATDKVQVFDTSRPDASPTIQREVVIEARHPDWLGALWSKSQYRCHVWCGPMHAFEHGNLVIWPNTLLVAGLGLLVGLPLVGLLRIRAVVRDPSLDHAVLADTAGFDLFQRLPWLKRLLQWREFTLVWLIVMGVGLYLVILTSLFGTHVAGRNFGVMMTWVVWMFLLTVVLTPWGGRIWCMACPLPLVGDVIQRGTLVGIGKGSTKGGTKGYHNRFFGLNLRWPQWLTNDWPRFFSFLTFGTFSAALVAYPKFSGLAILGLVVLAACLAPIFELRAFCRYLCPVTGFIGLYSRRLQAGAARGRSGRVWRLQSTHVSAGQRQRLGLSVRAVRRGDPREQRLRHVHGMSADLRLRQRHDAVAPVRHGDQDPLGGRSVAGHGHADAGHRLHDGAPGALAVLARLREYHG